MYYKVPFYPLPILIERVLGLVVLHKHILQIIFSKNFTIFVESFILNGLRMCYITILLNACIRNMYLESGMELEILNGENKEIHKFFFLNFCSI